MTITSNTVVDEITVSLNGCVSIRENKTILEDDKVIAKNYHRTTLVPAQDLTGQPNNVVAICNAAWTPEVIAAYQAQIEAETKALTTPTTGE